MVAVRKNFEFEGSSVEEAITKAIAKMGVAREDLSVRIVSEEQKGLFGMQGAKPAKIIVSVKNKKQ
jgi:spoIIIJ-associated protein